MKKPGSSGPLTDRRGNILPIFRKSSRNTGKKRFRHVPWFPAFVGKFIFKDNLAWQTTRMRVWQAACYEHGEAGDKRISGPDNP
jgi:hypothetical protein